VTSTAGIVRIVGALPVPTATTADLQTLIAAITEAVDPLADAGGET
jgi:hypothetical protein